MMKTATTTPTSVTAASAERRNKYPTSGGTSQKLRGRARVTHPPPVECASLLLAEIAVPQGQIMEQGNPAYVRARGDNPIGLIEQRPRRIVDEYFLSARRQFLACCIVTAERAFVDDLVQLLIAVVDEVGERAALEVPGQLVERIIAPRVPLLDEERQIVTVDQVGELRRRQGVDLDLDADLGQSRLYPGGSIHPRLVFLGHCQFDVKAVRVAGGLQQRLRLIEI